MTKAKPLPPLNSLKELLTYEAETGVFTWKNNQSTKFLSKKSVAGSNTLGYIGIRINKKVYKAHRLAWLFSTGIDPGQMQIDHINGIKCDNRIANLRLATSSQNNLNKSTTAKNTSGFKGVSYSKKLKAWKGTVADEGRNKHLGYFDTAELAHMAYCKAAAELHGDFARGA